MKKSLFLAVGFAFAVLPACNDSTGPNNAPCDAFLLQYGAAAGDTVSTTGGVRYIDIETGAGAEAAAGGDLAVVNYSLYLQETEQFIESSCGENTAAIPFQVGGPGIISGFSTGVVGMRAGGVRRVFVPSAAAYNDGNDLIFDLHLVELN